MQHRTLSWTTADGTRLSAQSWTPDSPAAGVVGVVHGLGDHSGRYAELAEAFAKASYSVLGFDQRGHGRTGGQRGHVADYSLLLDDVDVLVAEASQQAGQQSVFLYGHSLGGNIVLNYALRRQPKLAGLIAASPLMAPVTPPPAWQLASGRIMARLWPSFSFRLPVNSSQLSHEASTLQTYEEDPLVHKRVSARLAVQMLETSRWALEHAGELTVPSLLMHGDADQITSHEATSEFARRAGALCRLRIWKGLYHDLHWERERDEVIAYVVDWLNERAAAVEAARLGADTK